MQWTAGVYIAIALTLSGCIGASDERPGTATPSDAGADGNDSNGAPIPGVGAAENHPCTDPTVACTMEARQMECWDTVAVFMVETAFLQSYLPDGWVVEPAPVSLLRSGWSNLDDGPLPAHLNDLDALSLLAFVVHKCPSEVYGLGAMEELWVLAFVEPPAANDAFGFSYAHSDFYYICNAGGSEEVQARYQALGQAVCGDTAEVDDLATDAFGAHSGGGIVKTDDETVLSLSVAGAPPVGPHAQGHIRFWHESEHGIMVVTADFQGAGYDFNFSPRVSCSFAPASFYAELAGTTSCEPTTAVPAGAPAMGAINPPHTHTVTFEYLPHA